MVAVKATFFILTVLSGCHLYHSRLISQNCSTDCCTDPNKNFFNLECVHSYETLINIYFLEDTLHITHNEGLAVIDLNTFPKLNISQELRNLKQELRRIKMKNCTLRNGLSFGTLFEHFGIEDEILAFAGINIIRSPLSIDGRFSSGFERVENLTLCRNSIRQLNEQVFRSLPKLSNLDLSHNGIVAVHENVFKNLTELSTLKLNGNVLKSLSDGMFEHQKHLNVLCLQRNRLQNLTKGMFRGLDSLRALTLETNNISSLTNDVFHNLPSLLHITMGDSNLRMPYTIFAKQSLLKYVFLEKVKVNEGLNLSGLQILQIKWCEVVTLSGFSNIDRVSITESTIHPSALTSLTNLNSTKELNLSSNKIGNLVNGLFDGLNQLVLLRLSRNHLTNISGLVFRDLENLAEIDLSNNRLTTIHLDAFVNNEKLTIINLAKNELSFGDNKLPFMHLDNLVTLNLSNNKLAKMPSDLLKLEKLKEVDLSFNRISAVKFSELRQNIIKLNATYEILGSQDTRTYLNDNPLYCDCSMFDFLSGTDQQRFAPAFSSNCSKDACHRNTTDKCPTECNCTKLTNKSALHVFVSCRGKQLTAMPDIEFLNATAIYLDISNNNLTELPTLRPSSHVRFIQASCNQISQIKLENVPAYLRGLDLSHNNIQTIAANVIHRIKNHQSLEIFLMKDNPLACHCSSENTVELIKFVKENSSITDLQGTKCNVHNELSMEALQKTCRNNMIMYSLIIVTVLTLICGVLLVLFIKHRQFIEMWLYAHDWFLWWVDEEYMDRDKANDVFISYAEENKLLAYRIMYALEKCNIFTVHMHDRDYVVGELTSKSIYDAVYKSRRILVILSNNYVKSELCEGKFHLAWQRSVAEKRKLIIAVKNGKLGNIADETIQSYIKTHACIDANDKWLWERLIFHLPHKKMAKNIFPIREFEYVKE